MSSADLYISRMTRASALNKRFQALGSALSVCEEKYLSKVERAALHQIVVLQKLRNVSLSHGMLTPVSETSLCLKQRISNTH